MRILEFNIMVRTVKGKQKLLKEGVARSERITIGKDP